MPTAFKLGADRVPYVEADPNSDLDYSVASWLEGLAFISADWAVTPDPGAGNVHGQALNAAPVTVDGVEYAVNHVASAWVKGLTAGTTYEVRVRGTFEGNRIDDRTFKIVCKER